MDLRSVKPTWVERKIIPGSLFKKDPYRRYPVGAMSPKDIADLMRAGIVEQLWKSFESFRKK